MAEPTKLPVALELFSCERLSARLTVKACGHRFLRVRASSPGSQDYDSACDQCPVGEHHAKHGTLSPGAHAQGAATMPAAEAATTKSTTTTTTEETTMGAISDYTDDQKRDAVKRVLIENKTQAAVAEELSVTGTTVRNWIKRFGNEVASDAMDAATGKSPRAAAKPKDAKKAAPKPKRAAKDEAVPSAWAPFEGEPAPAAPSHPLAGFDRDTLGEMGLELGEAVRHIADEHVRHVVADAAWILTQAGHG